MLRPSTEYARRRRTAALLPGSAMSSGDGMRGVGEHVPAAAVDRRELEVERLSSMFIITWRSGSALLARRG